jgi:replicative DNA helicase
MNPHILQQLEGIISDAQNSEKELIHSLQELLVHHDLQTQRDITPKSVSSVIEDILRDREKKHATLEYYLPWENFNEHIGCLESGELVILGGRPAMGKTSLLLQLALHWTQPVQLEEKQIAQLKKLDLEFPEPVPVLYYSLDSTIEKIAMAAYCMVTGREKKALFKEDAALPDLLADAEKMLRDRPLYMTDKLFDTLYGFRNYLENIIKEKGIRIVMIDYIQLLGSFSSAYKRQLEMAYITRMFRNMAIEHKLLVILSSQLSRSVESRGGNKKPVLSDLRESGNLEQDADKVLMLYRPSYYDFLEGADGEDISELVEIIVGKNRNGPTGTVQLRWNKETRMMDKYTPQKPKWDINPDRLSDLF